MMNSCHLPVILPTRSTAAPLPTVGQLQARSVLLTSAGGLRRWVFRAEQQTAAAVLGDASDSNGMRRTRTVRQRPGGV